ncbi:P-type conjugative transfer protein TrbJ [Robiginitomaculum antarcticum]|uniref:P-type conjugative transfer protein TrbJ n=1 Tax=Robiginitomaculum antarcticum TaxID=437507 RepID=UPI00035CC0DC|nr:P-type conjugative transfer protein TrbJ [Robiginitomaculum antarcticum]
MARRGRVKTRIITLTAIAVLGLAYTPAAHAQFFGGIVYDPTNYVQNFQTAVHNHSQLIRQAQQLRNEANMLINQAKNLKKLDLNAVNELNRILGEIAYLNSQAENVAYEVSRTRQLVKEQYPDDYEAFSDDDLARRAEQQWHMSQAAYAASMIMQSKMVESLEEDRGLLTKAMNKSHGAAGELQAVQSTNQLIALLVKQNMQMQQMMVSQYRADSIDAARRIAIEKESQERFKRFSGSRSAYAGADK